MVVLVVWVAEVLALLTALVVLAVAGDVVDVQILALILVLQLVHRLVLIPVQAHVTGQLLQLVN